jgi:hypothetical protein
MPSTLGRIVGSVRRPEYTGENRCTPCTIVNVVIAAGLTVAVWTVSLPLAVAVLAVSLSAIALRGYLVPYTPTLTKRYLPDRVLRLFDKQPGPPPAADGEVDLEAVLREAGAVEDCPAEDDLCLTDSFRASWRDRVAAVRATDSTRDELAGLLGVDADGLTFSEHGSAFVASHDGVRVGQWESHAAFVADLAAARELSDRDPSWGALPVEHRGQVLSGLRLFIDTCPACDGRVTAGHEVVESCCRSIDVVAVSCEDCGARLFEVESPAA